MEPLRAVAGAGANTRDNPQRLVDFDPSKSHVGGIFDDKKRLVKSQSQGGAAGTSLQAQAQPER